MLTFRPRIRRTPKTYWLFAIFSLLQIPVLKQKRHYLLMGETIRIFLKTEKICMLFQTTRIRLDMASYGTCCELYFSAKQRDLNGNRSYKEPLRQSPAQISPFDV